MSYPLSDKLQSITEKGLLRLQKAMQLVLPEIPRLQKEFFSPDDKVKEKARREIVWLLGELDRLAREAAQEAGKTPQDLWQELLKASSLTPQEKEQLVHMQQVVREKKEELYPPNSQRPKKKRPRPPETHLKG